jgi:hypothetical protein
MLVCIVASRRAVAEDLGIHVKIIIFNWNMELNLRNTCHHKGGMERPWLAN